MAAEGPLVDDVLCGSRVESRRRCYFQENVFFSQVLPVGEIGMERRQVIAVAPPFRFGPQAQFLGQSAVVGFRPYAERESKRFGYLVEVGEHPGDVDTGAGEKFLQGASLFRGLRMERKGSPANVQRVGDCQFFNTPGNEVTPGSDIVGKDFECCHDGILLA